MTHVGPGSKGSGRSAGQVGGYVERYRGLTFATVRNAGHMVRPLAPARPPLARCKRWRGGLTSVRRAQVPYTQAERSYYLFSRWLNAAHSDASADLF